MLWTEEAIEVLKRLALEGRSASLIAVALGAASRNAVIGKANRIGIRLNGDGRASAPGGAPAGAYRPPLAASPSQACSRRGNSARALSSPGHSRGGEEGGMGLCRGRGWRNATGEVRGHPPIRLPMAARRSEERRFRLLRAHAGRGPLLLRRPLPDGLSPANGEASRHERRWSRALANPWRLPYGPPSGRLQVVRIVQIDRRRAHQLLRGHVLIGWRLMSTLLDSRRAGVSEPSA